MRLPLLFLAGLPLLVLTDNGAAQTGTFAVVKYSSSQFSIINPSTGSGHLSFTGVPAGIEVDVVALDLSPALLLQGVSNVLNFTTF